MLFRVTQRTASKYRMTAEYNRCYCKPSLDRNDDLSRLRRRHLHCPQTFIAAAAAARPQPTGVFTHLHCLSVCLSLCLCLCLSISLSLSHCLHLFATESISAASVTIDTVKAGSMYINLFAYHLHIIYFLVYSAGRCRGDALLWLSFAFSCRTQCMIYGCQSVVSMNRKFLHRKKTDSFN